MKYIYYYITAIFALLTGLTACSEEPEVTTIIEGEKSMPLEISTSIKKQTRSTVAGDDFVDGDTFILYHGSNEDIINGAYTSTYKRAEGKFSGTPGLFWDDLDITADNSFTGIMTNGGTLNLGAITPVVTPSTFTVPANQSTDKEYIKADLLVAYGIANYMSSDTRKLTLSFSHVFAHLKISITDGSVFDEEDKAPVILDENTVVTIENVQTGANLKFNVQTTTSTKGSTDVTPTGSGTAIITRRTQGGGEEHVQPFTYEAILPAQDMKEMVITFTNNTNGKEYSYALKDAIFKKGPTPEDLLIQGQSTTLNLTIKKTQIGISALIVPWVERTASAEATPEDYPVIEIGGDDDGGEDGLIKDNDDYAGKTIRLTSDVEASVLGLPIGSQDKPFRGTFDGQGYTILGVDLSNEDNAAFLGVFGYTDGATIRDLNVTGKGITNMNESATSATGGLVGYANNTYIENCHVDYTGGVSAAYDNAGGLVGYVNGISYIKYSSANTPVTAGHNYGGGLIGRSENGTNLSYSFATGNTEISGDYVGGLIGHTTGGMIEFCYAWGNAVGDRFAGGLIGRAVGVEGSKIANSYAAGTTVSGTSRGGLIGSVATSNYMTVKNCYWNVNLAGGLGCSNMSLGSTNISFSLVNNADAMATMLSGISVGEGEDAEWELTLRESDNFQLPILKVNNGKALPTQP